MSNRFFTPGSLNVFTDASVYGKPSKVTDVCAGFIPVYTDLQNNRHTMNPGLVIIKDATNNQGELTGIQLGLNYIKDNESMITNANLFSDSKISIYGLTRWIWSWNKAIREGEHNTLLKNYPDDPSPVANQPLIFKCIYTILSIQKPILLWHQKGHCKKDPLKAIKIFKESNGLELTIEEITDLNYFNEMIDTQSRAFLKANDLNTKQEDIYVPEPFTFLTDIDWGRYRYKIRGNNF